MALKGKRIVLTGACGGIGRHLAQSLIYEGAHLGLVDLRDTCLGELVGELDTAESELLPIAADITNAQDQQKILNQMQARFGGIDMLINNAGLMDFTEFADEDPEVMARLMKVNVLAPMQLTRAILPAMLQQGSGHIVNIGSIFGTLAFAYFTSYSASKFALRGFSEALRRELRGSAIDVSYIAPRAVKTALNNSAIMSMAAAVKMNMDDPESIAYDICQAIKQRKKEAYLGFPESFFARLNSLFPRLVDMALQKQNKLMQPFTHHQG